MRYVFAKRAVPCCLVFYNPFFFPRSKFCCKMLFEAHFFYPFSGHYLAKKIGQNFLKCCYKSNTTLPFVPYAKTKLISVLFSNVTQPPQLSAIAFSPPYFYHSPSKPMTCLPYESPIAQWLEHPTCIWKVVGLIPVKVLDFFSEHFFVVPNIYFWQSFIHLLFSLINFCKLTVCPSW